MNNVRTVSDTKRAFYSIHARPVNSIYRRVVEELLVEVHLLNVNEDFRYDPIFALGVTTTFDRFMDGYQPQQDQGSIFMALCQAQEMDPQKLRRDSQHLQELAQSKSAPELVEWITQAAESGGDEIQWQLRTIAQNTKFKYSRLFAIGLYTLLELADADWVKEDTQLTETLQQLGTSLNLTENKLQKDLELYRSNLDKIVQARQTMEDILQAGRHRQQQREAERQAKAEAQAQADSEEAQAAEEATSTDQASPSSTQPTDATTPSSTPTESGEEASNTNSAPKE